MSSRDEAYKRISQKFRFPLMHAEMEELLDLLAQAYSEGEAAAWNRHLPEWKYKQNPYKES